MISLVKLIDEHPDEIEYDLLRCGARLRQFPGEGVSWRDLAVLVRGAQPDSAVFKALNPGWAHDWHLEMLRSIEHSQRLLIWQNANRGAKPHQASRQPEVFYFPWEERPEGDGWRGDSLDWDEAADALVGDERLARLMTAA